MPKSTKKSALRLVSSLGVLELGAFGALEALGALGALEFWVP